MEKIWNAFSNFWKELRKVRWTSAKESKSLFLKTFFFIILGAVLIFIATWLILKFLIFTGSN